MRSNINDLTGKVFGKLTVIQYLEHDKPGSWWICKCGCGRTKKIRGTNLSNNHTKTCGCSKGIYHNKSRTPEYRTWQSIKERCYNKNNIRYDDYGGRGIKVCNRWLEGFLNFLEDMGERPSQKYSIERIDNDKDYKPSNCKWANATEQSINQRIRKDNKSGHKGVYWDKKRNKWGSCIGMNGKFNHIGRFDSKNEAIKARQQAETKHWNTPS